VSPPKGLDAHEAHLLAAVLRDLSDGQARPREWIEREQGWPGTETMDELAGWAGRLKPLVRASIRYSQAGDRQRLDRVLHAGVKQKMLVREGELFRATPRGLAWARSLATWDAVTEAEDSDPLHDAVFLCLALAKGPLGLTEAARALHPPSPDEDATPEAQEARLQALDRAAAVALERGWVEHHHGLLHVTDLGATEGATWFRDWR